MKRLIDIGFRKAGQWVGGQRLEPRAVLARFSQSEGVLYCFAVDGVPVYVATATEPIKSVMLGHVSEGAGLLDRIKTALGAGLAVDIYVLPDDGRVKWGEFILDIAGALEKNIIKRLCPPWNKKNGGM